ncbi:hypothetical protein NE237_027424 [Protea cynaroides]|uniref:Uncharacterized protein n=1 Tax=Protea cynaroides TaxID=273540 RepID=A0A9Q0GRB3_9MAGN|nr:hypothetical protein NE237_027424 [Protea cynaroides]
MDGVGISDSWDSRAYGVSDKKGKGWDKHGLITVEYQPICLVAFSRKVKREDRLAVRQTSAAEDDSDEGQQTHVAYRTASPLHPVDILTRNGCSTGHRKVHRGRIWQLRASVEIMEPAEVAAVEGNLPENSK